MFNYKSVYKQYIALAAVSLLTLAGCGGGSSDTATPENTKTTFVVGNKTAVDFASVIIQDRETGKTVYEGAFSCYSGQTECVLYYTGAEITGSAVLGFKNAQGKTIAFYDTYGAPGAYAPLSVSGGTTGSYLFEELLKASPKLANMTTAELGYRLKNFATNFSGATSSDHYSHLAAYYAGQNNEMDVSQFTSMLSKEIEDMRVPSSVQFNSTSFAVPVKTGLTAESRVCPPGTMLFVKILGKGIDVFDGLFKPFFEQIENLGDAACKPNETNAKLDDIIGQLNYMQKSVDKIRDSVGELSNLQAKAALEPKLKLFNSTVTDLATLSGKYETLRRGQGVGSLKAYVTKRYGTGADALEKAMADPINAVVLSPIVIGAIDSSNQNSYLKKIDGLTASDITFTDALNLLCQSPDVGDLVAMRSLCNQIIASSVARLAASQRMALTLASEAYDLLDAYPETASIYGYNVEKGAAIYSKELEDTFNTQASGLAGSFTANIVNSKNGNGYFYILDGLSTVLLDNMAKVQCADEAGRPLISGWVRSSRDEYLVTNCSADTVRSSYVLARYFLRVNNNSIAGRDNVTNLMGVLIPPLNSYTYMHSFGASKNDGKHAFLRFDRDAWSMAFRSEAYGADRPGSFVYNSSGEYKWILEGHAVVGKDMTSGSNNRLKLSGAWNNGTLKAKNLMLFEQNYDSSEWYDTWFRFTDTLGFSYVFLNQLYYNSPFKDLLCLTIECTGSDQGLSFVNGPQNLILKNADPGNKNLTGWQINGKFIDAE